MHASRRAVRASRSLVVAGIALLLVVQSADAVGVRTVLATTSNPYAACTIGAGGPFNVNYTNAEVEPWVAVNPRNPRNIVGGVQQDRWIDGGAHGLSAQVSKDGGKSFTVVALPFSSCAPGGLPYERASDPWVSFGPDGTLYAVSISFDENSWRSAVGAATSTDGGLTWGNVTEVAADTAIFHDKESVTADPTIPGRAYIVWDSVDNSDPWGLPEPNLISITSDYGHTWSAPAAITANSSEHGDIGNVIVVNQHNGTLYDFFSRWYTSAPSQYMVITSTDHGASWSAPTVVADDMGITDVDPHAGGPVIRTSSNAIESAAIDPVTGRLYLVWEDARFTGGTVNQVLLTSSANGSAWSTPRRVSTATGQAAWNPGIAVDAEGRVAVTYYDFRKFNPSNSALPTDYWMKISPRGGTRFGDDIRLTKTSFDMLATPYAGGMFVGDYEGVAAGRGAFYSLWCGATGDPNNMTDCYLSTVATDH